MFCRNSGKAEWGKKCCSNPDSPVIIIITFEFVLGPVIIMITFEKILSPVIIIIIIKF